MDFTYSPHRETGGTLHLASPTHTSHVDGFTASVNNLRRSLSRSPSKSSQFQFSRTPSGSPGSPLSPLALARAFTPKSVTTRSNQGNSTAGSPDAEQLSAPKKKFSLRRTAVPFRSSPRMIASTRSPMRRVLSDNSNSGNTTPSASRRSSGEENSLSKSDSPIPKSENKPPLFRFDVNDGPIKFEFARPKQETMVVMADAEPMRSSPLKRSERNEGSKDLGEEHFGAPVKRRSLHAASFGPDADVFSQSSFSMSHNSSTANNVRDIDQEKDREIRTRDRLFASEQGRDRHPVQEYNFASFSSPAVKRTSSLRKAIHRQTPIFSRSRGFLDTSQEALSFGSPAHKVKNRMSLDGSSLNAQGSSRAPLSPFVIKSSHSSTSHPLFPQSTMSRQTSTHQPHPLSQAIIPSSSASSIGEDTTMSPAPMADNRRETSFQRVPSFSKSLPIGAVRPSANSTQGPGISFATPIALREAEPMTTGFISKRFYPPNYNPYNDDTRYDMPDTPSKFAPTLKRSSFPPDSAVSDTPLRQSFNKRPNFDRAPPESPLITHSNRSSFGIGAEIFRGDPTRRSSLVSNDGEANQQETQSSSADELPPTPTKPASSGRAKPSSLRSSMFGRRTSLAPDTFTPPDNTTSENATSPRLTRKVTPVNQIIPGRTSPHTPEGSFAPPDPSSLSISGFRYSTGNAPPATPTAPRDNRARNLGPPQNDVDPAITVRFASVIPYGRGEFSMVYRVEKPLVDKEKIENMPPFSSFDSTNRVWVVKKTKKPYIGMRDRARKIREALMLDKLRGCDHIVQFVCSWECEKHLYMQTEFCEAGSLDRYLDEVGRAVRLDDFRIWKILFELCLGIKEIHDHNIIHLDLKPANIFVTFEGVLKIGDFGVASDWPAPDGIDEEGDREYMGPEVLNGHIDKPADIFSLGIITLEMAGNIFIPDNGDLWQNLRNGNLRNIPTLTWSTDSALERDADGVAINHPAVIALANAPPVPPMPGMPPVRRRPSRPRVPELPTPPQFMSEAGHPGSLDNLVHWMLSPDPNDRPTVDQLIQCPTLRWIAHRLRDAATIYEGNWGPALTGKENDPIPALGPFGPRMIPNEIENYPLPDMPPPGKYPTDEEFDRENIEDYDDRNKNGGDDIEMSGVD